MTEQKNEPVMPFFFFFTVNLQWRWQRTILSTWPVTLRSKTLKVKFPLDAQFCWQSTEAFRWKKNAPLQSKRAAKCWNDNNNLHTVVINSTVLIILLLVSPLAMFILHKKHTYCSMRRNCVIFSSLETSRSGHTKEKKKQRQKIEQAHTKLPIILASCTAG